MKATDQLLTAVLILANKASRVKDETIDETIQAFEDAGLMTHMYIKAPDRCLTCEHLDGIAARPISVPCDKPMHVGIGGDVVIEYNFTPKFQMLIEGI